MLLPEIKTVHIPVEELIEKYRDIPKFLNFCKACPRYDKCWACPPHAFDTTRYFEGYRHAYILGAKINIPAETIAQVKGKEAVAAAAESITKEARKELDPILLAMEERIPNALCCYGGTCILCEACTKIKGKPCRFPEKRRPSLEAVGFDVAAITQDLFGFELLWSEDSLPAYLTVISALLTKDVVKGGF